MLFRSRPHNQDVLGTSSVKITLCMDTVPVEVAYIHPPLYIVPIKSLKGLLKEPRSSFCLCSLGSEGVDRYFITSIYMIGIPLRDD